MVGGNDDAPPVEFKQTLDHRGSTSAAPERAVVYGRRLQERGTKMIGVGALVAREILEAREEILEPFRFARYAGNLHLVSNSPYPWS